MCCGNSKEPCQWDGSFEQPKHMIKLMGKEINVILGASTILIWTYGFILLSEMCSGCTRQVQGISMEKGHTWMLEDLAHSFKDS